MERAELYKKISNTFYLEGFNTDDVEAGNGRVRLRDMGLVIELMIYAIMDEYGVHLEGITLETTFDELVDAVLALLS